MPIKNSINNQSTGFTVGSTGNLTITNGNVGLPTTTATSGILTVNSTRFMHAYGTNNTFLGSSAGNFTLTATQATAIGASAGNNISTGGNSVYIGYQAGNTVSGGNENTVIGSQAFASANAGQNVVIGYRAGFASTGFTACTVVGKFALNNTNTGSYNLMLGYGSGTNYTGSESSNICLHSDGVLGDNNTLRIGESTGTGNRQIQNTYIQGYVNLPGQVSFGAFLSVGLANQTGAGGSPDIAFNAVTTNVGNAYNAANGRVTAPVTGKYLIGANVNVNNISALMTSGELNFWRFNAAGVAISAYAYNFTNPAAGKTPSNLCSFQGHIVIPMNATDYVTVKCILTNGAGNTAGYSALGARETSIYGQLLS